MNKFESMETSSSVAVAAVLTALAIAWLANAVSDTRTHPQAAANAPVSAKVAGDGETLVVTAGRLPPAKSGAPLPASAKAARQPST